MPEPLDEKPKRGRRGTMDLHSVGQLMLVGGIVIAILGGALMLLARVPIFGKLGSLPGDIRIEGDGFACIIPLASMILISVLLTVVLNIVVRLINRQ